MADPDPIAVQMREARQRRGWSLVDAEQHAGIDAMVIGSWERGDRQPSLTKLRRWVEAFGLQLLAIGGVGDPARVGLNGQTWTEYAVAYGDTGRIACDTAEEAEDIAARMPGACVKTQQVYATGWRKETNGDD